MFFLKFEAQPAVYTKERSLLENVPEVYTLKQLRIFIPKTTLRNAFSNKATMKPKWSSTLILR